MDPAEKRRWTPAEYLAMERGSDEKHELFRGEVFAMSGASLRHNRLVANLVMQIGNALAGKPCEVLPSDMRVRVPSTELYTYPDLSVVCGSPRLDEDGFDTLLNPTLLVEVLSDSTEKWDRGKKFEHYRTIPSLREYVLVSQDAALVESYARQPDGSWVLRVYRAGDRVALPALEVELAVDEIYRRVFDEPAA